MTALRAARFTAAWLIGGLANGHLRSRYGRQSRKARRNHAFTMGGGHRRGGQATEARPEFLLDSRSPICARCASAHSAAENVRSNVDVFVTLKQIPSCTIIIRGLPKKFVGLFIRCAKLVLIVCRISSYYITSYYNTMYIVSIYTEKKEKKVLTNSSWDMCGAKSSGWSQQHSIQVDQSCINAALIHYTWNLFRVRYSDFYSELNPSSSVGIMMHVILLSTIVIQLKKTLI